MMAALDCRTEVGPLWVGDGHELRSPMISEMVVGLASHFLFLSETICIGNGPTRQFAILTILWLPSQDVRREIVEQE